MTSFLVSFLLLFGLSLPVATFVLSPTVVAAATMMAAMTAPMRRLATSLSFVLRTLAQTLGQRQFLHFLAQEMLNLKETLDVAVVDQSGIVMPHLESGDRVTYEDHSSEVPDSIKAHLKDYGKDALVIVSPLDTVKKTVSVQAYSKDPLGVEFTSGLADKVDDAVEEYRIAQYGIDNLPQIMEDVKSHVRVTEFTLDDSGKESVSESGIYMIVSMLLGIIIWMFIMMFGGQVMSSVIEEKSSRVVEVLISSVKAVDLMFGKIIGVALVALTQFFLWIVLTVVLTSRLMQHLSTTTTSVSP